MTGHRRPRIEDVARVAGVSTATVSRCLNTPGSVRKQTREAVEKVIAHLGYAPHFGARALVLNRTHTIGAVIPTMENAIFARGMQAVQERLTEAGTTMLLGCSAYRPEEEARQIEALIRRGVDGILLIGEERPDSTYALLDRNGIPLVLVWCNGETTSRTCVGFDNRAAAREMADVVLQFGHREIAMISGIRAGNDRAARRVEGVRAALSRAGLALGDDRLVEVPYTLEDGAKALKDIMDRGRKPTAVICGNDVLAVGAIRGAREIGLRVPDDLSITGFDNIDLAAVVTPALTTVHVPHRRMGSTAAEILLDLQAGNTPAGNVSFETEVRIRDSLARI